MTAALDHAGDLTPRQARELTDRIRTTLTSAHDLIREAWQRGAWTALGYGSWDDYCAEEFSHSRMVRLDREQRREIVAELSSAGMSDRAIASGLGVPRSTIRRDTRTAGGPFGPPAESDRPVTDAGGANEPPAERDNPSSSVPESSGPPAETAPVAARVAKPATVTGLDGKTYSRPAPKPAETKPSTKRKPLTDAFFDASHDLVKAAERIQRLADDERFPRNAEQVARKYRRDLLNVRDVCQDVLNRFPTNLT